MPAFKSKGAAWFELKILDWDQDIHQTCDYEGAKKVAQMINELALKEEQLLGDSKKLFFAGFSQGGPLAGLAASNHPRPVGGILFYSTFLNKPYQISETQSYTPIYWSHGTEDSINPYKQACDHNEGIFNGKRTVKHTLIDGLGHSVTTRIQDETKKFMEEALAFNRPKL